MLLTNRVAIVTGGAKGIGYAIVRRFLEEGAHVVIADIDEEAGEKAAGELRRIGRIRYMACDVAERLDVRNAVAATIDAFGDIDILVNNAAILHRADFLDLDAEDFDKVLDVNLKGAFLFGQAVARHMVERVKAEGRAGTIVNVSSINAVLANPDGAAYAVSKSGVAQLTRVMALSLAPYGIRVNAVGPGAVATGMFETTVETDPAVRRMVLSRTPLGRIGEPREIAAIATFLASDEASYVTGQTLYADGGRLPLDYTVPVKP